MDTDDPMPAVLTAALTRTRDEAVVALSEALAIDASLAAFAYRAMVKGLACSALHDTQWRRFIAMLCLRVLGHDVRRSDDVRRAFDLCVPRRAPAND